MCDAAQIQGDDGEPEVKAKGVCAAGTTKQQQHDHCEELSSTRRIPNPLEKASFLSRLLFLWPNPLLRLGMQRPLRDEDLAAVAARDSSRYNLHFFRDIWNAECQRHPSSRPSLHRALLTSFLRRTWFVQPMMLAAYTAKVVQALVLGNLIEYFQGHNDRGFLWATCLVFCAAIILFSYHHVSLCMWRTGMQYRTACVAAIYDKSLRLSSTHQGTLTSYGHIMNLASNDVERFLLASVNANPLFWAPVQSITILAIGIWILGPAFAAGFALLIVVLVPLQSYLSHQFAQYRTKVAAITDQRVTFVSQAVRGARLMKMSGYEHRFLERAQALRAAEVARIRKANRLKSINGAVFFATNVVISLAIFLVHVALGGTLTTGVVFTVFMLINVLQVEMVYNVSWAIMSVSECHVSITRIQQFLEFPEVSTAMEVEDSKDAKQIETVCEEDQQQAEFSTSSHSDDPQFTAAEGEAQSLPSISLSNVTCFWDDVKRVCNQKDEELTAQSEDDSNNDDKGVAVKWTVKKECSNNLFLALDQVSVDFRPGEVTAVIGTMGSGKSALLQALAHELPVNSGRVTRRYGSLAYAAQDPWIMNGTVRENILLDRSWNANWYKTVIEACGLALDLRQWRYGDETMVGDRGVQCSGGQRARIGLARALYKDADVLVADDPLSAVDAKVGKQLYEQALVGLAANRGKCVVLATHQHQYIRDCLQVVLLVHGRVPCVGSYEECVRASEGRLTAHAAHDIAADNLVEDNGEEIQKGQALIERQVVADDDISEDEDHNKNSDEEFEDDNREMNVQGSVQLDTYLGYCRAMGGLWVGLFLFVLYCATQASVLVTIAFTGKWAEMPADEQDDWRIQSLVSGMAAAVVLLGLFRAFITFFFFLRASQQLHDRMTEAVLRSKIEFFDRNPIGRIMNRFSADVGSNDDLLPQTLYDFCAVFFIVMGAVATTVFTLPFTLVAIPPLLCYFFRVRNIFLTSTRELKRLEGLARSPIFAMLSEALSGIATIRSNAVVPYFRTKFERLHDAHTRAVFGFISASRWVGFRMDGLMFLFLTLASYLSVVFHQEGWFNVDPAVLGLALSMLLQVAGIFQWCIQQSAEVVNQMVSVERVMGFGMLEPEAALELPGDGQRGSWPGHGAIDVQDLSVRYRYAMPLALNHVSFTIPPGARVGVVGRTGSGKSTFVQTLFRLLQAESGRIIIDGVDIATVGLHALRTKISVIPQEPTLFSGCTVRENLDLFGLHSDNSLRQVLLDCHLSDVIAELPSGWDSLISDGGSNFSVGQRQLLCLARAMLSKNKILVLDEATASIDKKTDQLLQEALKISFHDCTILAVAHRLDTVIESDYILVLGQGRVLEFGSPADLLDRGTGGAFGSMVNDTGGAMANELRLRALQQQHKHHEIPKRMLK